MRRYAYLVFNLVVIVGPAIAILFYRPINYPAWQALMPALFLSACLFIILDQWATSHFWYFNRRYLLGLFIGRLPIEEWLFFFTVPFACIILWINLKPLLSTVTIAVNWIVILMMLLILLIIVTAQKKLHYTSSVLIGFFILIAADLLLSVNLILNLSFWLFMILVNCLTLIFNAYLVNLPIVRYFAKPKTGWQLINIPIEDFLYGMDLLYLNLLLYTVLV